MCPRPNKTSEQTMSELTAVRLYFPLSARAKGKHFWHRLTTPGLGHHLLRAAKLAHIQQAVMLPVTSGYLPGEKLQHDHFEGRPAKLPQCIELVDTESKLRRFLHDHKADLEGVRAVLYRCELPFQP